MKCALLGFGRAGKIHYNNILNSSANLELAYIFDTRIDEINKELNNSVCVTNNFNDILNDFSIQAVIICTPTNLHFRFIKLSLENGKHVLCEKPLSYHENEINECYKLAEKNNLVLLCAFNRRFDPQIIKIREDLHRNKIGKVHQINTISRDYPYPTYNYLIISGGIIHDCAVHDIDFINWILNDKPISVYVTGNIVTPYNINGGTLDNAIIILEYSNGILVNINCSRISTNYDQRIEIYGERGTLISSNPYQEFDTIPISFPEV